MDSASEQLAKTKVEDLARSQNVVLHPDTLRQAAIALAACADIIWVPVRHVEILHGVSHCEVKRVHIKFSAVEANNNHVLGSLTVDQDGTSIRTWPNP